MQPKWRLLACLTHPLTLRSHGCGVKAYQKAPGHWKAAGQGKMSPYESSSRQSAAYEGKFHSGAILYLSKKGD